MHSRSIDQIQMQIQPATSYGEVTLHKILENDPSRLIIFPSSEGEADRHRQIQTLNQLYEIRCLTHRWSPVHLAVIFGDIELLNALLNAGASPCVKNDRGDTPLHLSSNPKISKALVSAKADIHARNIHKSTPLHMSANYNTSKFLLDIGAKANVLNKGKSTCLHYAKDSQTTSLLIENGANVNLKNLYGHPPLYLAVSKGRWETVMTLLEHGAYLQLNSTKEKNTVLEVAQAVYNNREMLSCDESNVIEKRKKQQEFQNLQNDASLIRNDGNYPNKQTTLQKYHANELLRELDEALARDELKTLQIISLSTRIKNQSVTTKHKKYSPIFKWFGKNQYDVVENEQYHTTKLARNVQKELIWGQFDCLCCDPFQALRKAIGNIPDVVLHYIVIVHLGPWSLRTHNNYVYSHTNRSQIEIMSDMVRFVMRSSFGIVSEKPSLYQVVPTSQPISPLFCAREFTGMKIKTKALAKEQQDIIFESETTTNAIVDTGCCNFCSIS